MHKRWIQSRESNESPNSVNIDENPDQLESNSASANAGDECSQLNTLHAAHIQKNRLVLKSIISAVEFCGRQGIALRGHRDDAKYLDNTDLNPGKYNSCHIL